MAERKRDKSGRFIPAKRRPGAGRKKSSPRRQYLAEVQPCRRTEPVAPATGPAPLAVPPPDGAGDYAKYLWELLVEQDADCMAKNVAPTVGMAQYGLAHNYVSSFQSWRDVADAQMRFEDEFVQQHADKEHPDPESMRWRARWRVDPETNDLVEREMWKVERVAMEACRKAARALGVGANHPMVAMQLNMNQQTVNPQSHLCGAWSKRDRVIDAPAAGQIVEAGS